MKWLFFILVVLNIIVFGGMVATRVSDKQKEAAVAADVADRNRSKDRHLKSVELSQQKAASSVEIIKEFSVKKDFPSSETVKLKDKKHVKRKPQEIMIVLKQHWPNV